MASKSDHYTVEPLQQPVPLRVVSSCGRVVEVEQAAQGRPQWGRELGPSVGGDGGRHALRTWGSSRLANRALAQSVAVMEGSGISSGHRDVLSIAVNR